MKLGLNKKDDILQTRFSAAFQCLTYPLPDCLAVLEISTGLAVRDRQLWRRTGNFLLIFLQFYVYDLRFKTWGATTFLIEFQTLLPRESKTLNQASEFLQNCLISRSHNGQTHGWPVRVRYGVSLVSSKSGLYSITLNLHGPSYLDLIRSISWLLMPWLLTSPGYQQPWYWLC